MRHFLVLIAAAFIMTGHGLAQNNQVNGLKHINFGVGFSGIGIPIYGGLEIGVAPNITLGFAGSFRTFNESYSGKKYGHTVIGASVLANYYFDEIAELDDPWDLYAGLNLGYFTWNSPSDYPGGFNSGLGLGAQVGGRYFFNNTWAVNLELGGGIAASGGKIGATYRF